ncbi:RsmB/NOP family class I SAM-dependent RNA methyltransferase [Sphingobacterium sp. 2149]|uniref:RsmB/NOP family class I SAM-dependent RNA methyltransferase n=1 Tax=Sphingobacterium sp. 2149 TaxID=2817763 RepID=UPI001AE1B112|nr:RsmB/NOP family class I SAM-dependent RNA methyltransferase [Sphingobacterium sp. 2149]MDR6737938.1 16S rRNA C967 or C1407 C5-methylase (RsmB/RsmF family)/NOL1/NOP2/fmu family ribosome biogenesis protein [Sphingobacterium sp. 2149]
MSNFLPNALVKKLGVNPLFDKDAFIKVHEEGIRATAIRLNPNKLEDCPFPNAGQVPWCNVAYYLQDRPVFTLDPLFHAGAYYPQDASSMFIDHIIRSLKLHEASIRALDLCAAPGGKSTLLNSSLHPESLLVANEIIKTRVTILQDNLMKWGNANTVTTNNDPAAFNRLPGYFDLMVVDAPCSGSGMFRKDTDAIEEWSEANVKLCSERQKRILAESLTALKEGGYLFYSTCSYSSEENEDIVDWLLDSGDFESVEINVEDNWGIDHTFSVKHRGHGYRFYPHKLGGEGFFIAVLKKVGEQETFNRKRIKPEKSDVPKGILNDWISNSDSLHTFLHHEDVYVFPKMYENDLKYLQNVLYLKNAGTNVGKVNRKELIPSHALALSNYLAVEYNAVDLSLEDARNYLRKENIVADTFADGIQGWTIARFKGQRLGWMKVLPNRINNYYPKELRIVNL